jgi:hypothetical protein
MIDAPDFSHLSEKYLHDLRKACEGAIEGRHFGDEARTAFVLGMLADAGCENPRFLGTVRMPDFGEKDAFQAARAERAGLIEQSSRGTWLLTIQSHEANEPGAVWYAPMIAAGGGQLGSTFGHHLRPPSFEIVRAKMVGRESYLVVCTIQSERQIAANIQALARLSPSIGTTYRNLAIDGVAYSRAEVTEINPAHDPSHVIVGPDDRGDGYVRLTLRKRGSKKRYTATIAARRLETALRANR